MGVNRTKTDQYQLRLPPGLRDDIKSAADLHSRSMNAEIVARLEDHPRLVQHVSYLKMENERLATERAAMSDALAKQKSISAQLQHLINERFEDAERDQQTANVIEEKFNELKAQSDYLDALKAELLELSKERHEIDHDKDKLIEEQSKVIDHLSSSLKQGRRLMGTFLNVIKNAASGDASALEQLLIRAQDSELSAKLKQPGDADEIE